MRYCLTYNSKSAKACKEADEVIFSYSPEARSMFLNTIETFFNETKKRIIIAAPEDSAVLPLMIEDLLKLKINCADIDITVKALPIYFECLKQVGLKYYNSKILTTWDEVYIAIEEGVSDITIGGPLGFELKTLTKVLKGKNINVRAVADVAQFWKGTPSIIGFFIIPEDVKIYEPYINTLELGNSKRIDILLNIYKEGKWLGRYNEIIFGLDSPLNGRSLFCAFGQRRINCERKCLKGGNCKRCFNCEEVCEKLNETNLILVKKEED